MGVSIGGWINSFALRWATWGVDVIRGNGKLLPSSVSTVSFESSSTCSIKPGRTGGGGGGGGEGEDGL